MYFDYDCITFSRHLQYMYVTCWGGEGGGGWSGTQFFFLPNLYSTCTTSSIYNGCKISLSSCFATESRRSTNTMFKAKILHNINFRTCLPMFTEPKSQNWEELSVLLFNYCLTALFVQNMLSSGSINKMQYCCRIHHLIIRT